MGKDYERRLYVPDQLRLQAADGDKAPLIQGHAAVFNLLSEDLGGFREQIAPGAFSATIQARDTRALLNHNADMVLGRRGAGTLRLVEDETGLSIEIDPPDTTFARDLLVSMGRGDVKEMSFGFVAVRDDWKKDGDIWIRTLLEVDLFEVSPVTFPAYTQTSVSARSMNAWQQAKAADVPPPDPDDVADEMRRLRLRMMNAA